MLNEVYLRHQLRLVENPQTLDVTVFSIIELEVETWYPFYHKDPNLIPDRFEVELRALLILDTNPGGGNGPTVVLDGPKLNGSFAPYDEGYMVHKLNEPTLQAKQVTVPAASIPNGDPARIFADAYGFVNIVVLEKVSGRPVDHLLFEISDWSSIFPGPIQLGDNIGVIHKETNDPRINWRWADEGGDSWQP